MLSNVCCEAPADCYLPSPTCWTSCVSTMLNSACCIVIEQQEAQPSATSCHTS